MKNMFFLMTVVWSCEVCVLSVGHSTSSLIPFISAGSCRSFQEGCDSENRFTDSLQPSGWICLPLVLMSVPDVAVERSLL